MNKTALCRIATRAALILLAVVPLCTQEAATYANAPGVAPVEQLRNAANAIDQACSRAKALLATAGKLSDTKGENTVAELKDNLTKLNAACDELRKEPILYSGKTSLADMDALDADQYLHPLRISDLSVQLDRIASLVGTAINIQNQIDSELASTLKGQIWKQISPSDIRHVRSDLSTAQELLTADLSKRLQLGQVVSQGSDTKTDETDSTHPKPEVQKKGQKGSPVDGDGATGGVAHDRVTSFPLPALGGYGVAALSLIFSVIVLVKAKSAGETYNREHSDLAAQLNSMKLQFGNLQAQAESLREASMYVAPRQPEPPVSQRYADDSPRSSGSSPQSSIPISRPSPHERSPVQDFTNPSDSQADVVPVVTAEPVREPEPAQEQVVDTRPSGNPVVDYNRARAMGAAEGEGWFLDHYRDAQGLSCQNLESWSSNSAAQLRFEPSRRGVFLGIARDRGLLVFPAFTYDYTARKDLEGVFLYPRTPGGELSLSRPAVLESSGGTLLLQSPGEFMHA